MKNENIQLENMIQNTLCYFDIFEYPLTLFEIWVYLYSEDATQKDTLEDIKHNLENLKQQQKVEHEGGYFFLRGRNFLVQKRKSSYKNSVQKYNKFLWKLRILSWFPGVKMIGVCNSLPIHNAHEDGDIDMFIISEHGRIWTTRFWLVSFLKLMKWRPTEKNKKDKLCPSFFMSDHDTCLENYQIQDDIYLRFWVATMLPIYYEETIVRKWQQDNSWLYKYLPNCAFSTINSFYRIQHFTIEQWAKKFFKFVLHLIPERAYKKLQMKALPQHLKDIVNKSTSVVISDSMLKFHDKDRREYYRDRYKDKRGDM